MSGSFPSPTPDQLDHERDVLAAQVAEWRPTEVETGRVLVARRDWPPPWPVWVLTFGIGLLAFAIPGQSVGDHLFVYLVVTVLIGLFVVATGLAYEIQVREHAVVIRTRVGGRPPRVLPLWSMDPSRIRFHRSSPAMQRRLQGDSAFSGFALMYRTAIYSRTALSIEGVDLAASDRTGDRVRLEARPPRAGQRVLRVGGPGWRFFGDPTAYALSPYVVSTRRPHDILAAVEQAMVAEGRESVVGLADWVVAHPVQEDRRHPLTEEQVYGRTTSPYPWFEGPAQDGSAGTG